MQERRDRTMIEMKKGKKKNMREREGVWDGETGKEKKDMKIQCSHSPSSQLRCFEHNQRVRQTFYAKLPGCHSRQLRFSDLLFNDAKVRRQKSEVGVLTSLRCQL